MTDEADRLVRRIEAIDTAAIHNEQRAESFRQMAEQLRAVEGRASSSDGVVAVVAAPGGTINSVRFTAKLAETDPDQLSAVVTHTIAVAQADAAHKQAEVVKAALGSTELLDTVLAEDEALFGDQPSQPGRAPEPATPVQPIVEAPRGPARDEEEFGGFSVFENRPVW